MCFLDTLFVIGVLWTMFGSPTWLYYFMAQSTSLNNFKLSKGQWYFMVLCFGPMAWAFYMIKPRVLAFWNILGKIDWE